MKTASAHIAAIALAIGVLGVLGGCANNYEWDPETNTYRRQSGQPATRADVTPTRQTAVPKPIHLLLPRKIRIHSFTGTRTFHEAGGVNGIDVHIDMLDAFGDATKAFGHFRFELHEFVPNQPDPKGRRVAVWEVPLLDAKKNLVHWSNITRKYTFKLQWDAPIAVGSKFVLVAVFSSPFTERLFSERVFISGE